MNKPTIADLPPRYQAQALAQLAAVPHPRTVQLQHAAPVPAKKAPSRIRQNSAGLNKTEQAFFDYLKAPEQPGVLRTVLPPQSITLRIANGCRYTPDFVVAYHHSGHGEDGWPPCVDLVAYEVKGFMRDDAAVKIKVAATAFPWITFHLVTKLPGGGGGWAISEVQK